MLVWLFVSLSLGGLLMHWLAPDSNQPASPEMKFHGFVTGLVFLHGTALLLITVLVRQHHVTWMEAFGFNTPELGRSLALATLAGLAVLPVALGLAAGSGQLMTWLAELTRSDALAPVTQQAVQTIRESSTPEHQLFFGLFAIVLAPVVEELLFRGVLYPAIKQNGYPRAAWLGTSFIFALTHANTMTFLSLFVLSLLLIWLYERTANLLAPILTHSLFNAVNFFFLIQSQTGSAPPHG